MYVWQFGAVKCSIFLTGAPWSFPYRFLTGHVHFVGFCAKLVFFWKCHIIHHHKNKYSMIFVILGKFLDALELSLVFLKGAPYDYDGCKAHF